MKGGGEVDVKPDSSIYVIGRYPCQRFLGLLPNLCTMLGSLLQLLDSSVYPAGIVEHALTGIVQFGQNGYR